MCPSGKHMRDTENEYPRQLMMFSPPFLMSKPPPSLRSSQAIRLVTSNARLSDPPGAMASCTHRESAGRSLVSEAQLCQSPVGVPPLPPPPGPGLGGAGG